MAAIRRSEQLGLSYEDQHLAPSNDRCVYDRVFWDHYRKRNPNRLHYPRCFIQRDQKAYQELWNKEFQSNPAPFLASTDLARMQARQRQRPSVYTHHHLDMPALESASAHPSAAAAEREAEEDARERAREEREAMDEGED
jgi:hypothetical protein